ncbi:MAG: two-component system sensor histidine kinase NtrB [Thermoanaerobaculia bacterium]
MPSVSPAGLTRLGFRRDIKLFLAVLIGYFIVVILLLLLSVQSALLDVQRAAVARREAVADLAAATAAVESTPELLLVALRTHADVIGVSLERQGRTLEAGTTTAKSATAVRRLSPDGPITIHFDDSAMARQRRNFAALAAICLGGSLVGTLLLLLYLKRVLHPIETMLRHAEEIEERSGEVDEAQYLVDTFRKSVEILRTQKLELEQLHLLEKTRADDLERVTATLTRSLTTGFIATDRDGRIVRLNRAAREILGLEDGIDFEGRGVIDVFGENELSSTLRAALDHRETLVRHETGVRRGTSSVTVGLTTVPLLDDAHDYLGTIIIIADLTEVRSLETRVREMQTLADLGEMSAGIAHEFRNSLATILGYLRLLRKGELTTEAATRLQSAEDEADQLRSAVEALLRFAGPIEPRVAEVDVRGVVAPIVARLEEENPEIAFELTGDWFAVNGDSALLSRMFENLLLNAVDAVAEKEAPGGRVSVHASAGEQRRVEVSDNGIGLDPNDANRLFLPFQSGKARGFGLGLSLARKIALIHGGRIELAGTPGEGAKVTVLLPDDV